MWPDRIRRTCRKLTRTTRDEPEQAVLLLSDLRDLFVDDGRKVWSTSDVLDELRSLEERPWCDWRYGKPLSPRQLAGLLRPFGVRPKEHRKGTRVFRGYCAKNFEDAFARYLP